MELTSVEKIKILEGAHTRLKNNNEIFLCIALGYEIQHGYPKTTRYGLVSEYLSENWKEMHDKIFDKNNPISPEIIIGEKVWRLNKKILGDLNYYQELDILLKHKLAFIEREIKILKLILLGYLPRDLKQ